MAFAQIYICSEHGETIHPTRYDVIDTENDEVDSFWVCYECSREVEPLMDGDKPVVRPLTDDEMLWDSCQSEVAEVGRGQL